MKRWKLQLILTAVLLALIAIFAFFMHQRIAAITPNTEALDAKDERLGSLCGKIIGIGLAFIWLLPFVLHRFRKS